MWLKRWWKERIKRSPKPLISLDRAGEIAESVRAEHGQRRPTLYNIQRDGDYWVVKTFARPPDVFIIHCNTGEVKEFDLVQIGTDSDSYS